MSSPNGPITFQVTLSGKVSQQIKGAFQTAAATGLQGSFLQALRKIHERLKKDPDVFGEPRYNLKHLTLQVRIGIILPCVVMYGVNTGSRKVYVNNFRFFGVT